MFSTLIRRLLISSALSSAAIANATTITTSAIIDLSDVTISADSSGGKLISGFGTTLVPTGGSFVPTVGDILITTVAFANGDRLKITGGPNVVDSSAPTYFSSLAFYFATAGGSLGSGYNSNTTSVSYTNLIGTGLGGFGNSGSLGQSIMSELLLGQSSSFTGLTLTSTITAASGAPNTFTQFGLSGGRAGDYEIISGNGPSVPESTTVGMLILCSLTGLIGLRAYADARRQTAVARITNSTPNFV